MAIIDLINYFGLPAANVASSGGTCVITGISCGKTAFKAVISPSIPAKVLYCVSSCLHGTSAVLSYMTGAQLLSIFACPTACMSASAGYACNVLGTAVETYADCVELGISKAVVDLGTSVLNETVKNTISKNCFETAFQTACAPLPTCIAKCII